MKSLIGLGAGIVSYTGLEFVKNNSPALTLNPIKLNRLENSSSFIITPTYDQSGQAMHPSVIDFKTEYGLESWCGFRYWMAFTPYPHFNPADENPSLLVSKDGLTWSNPPTLINPVVPRPSGPININFNSDPELIYDVDNNQLLLYWREYYKMEYEKIWLKKFDSSLVESAKFLCLDFVKPWKSKHSLSMSPTIWRKSANQWYMWTTTAKPFMNLYTSQDGIAWSEGQPCTTPWDTWNGGFFPWHVTAKPNYRDQIIEFLICGWPKRSGLFQCKLFHAIAPMDQPSKLTMPLRHPILGSGAVQQWDNGFIYRSSFVIDQEGTSQKYRVWYSACSTKKVWHIGYAEGNFSSK